MIPKLLTMLLATLIICGAGPVPAGATETPISNDSVLDAQVRQHLQGVEGIYGVAVVNIRDGRTVMVNADTAFPMASMYKLLVMYRVFEGIESGRIRINDVLTIMPADRVFSEYGDDLPAGHELTVADALRAMIAWSSNPAANALVRKVGGWDVVYSAAAETGIEATVADEQFWVTPADLVSFFYKLVGGSLLSSQSSAEMLSLLLQQETNDRIPMLLPKGTQVAHKPGELEDIRADGGIVFGPKAAYIIVLMSYQGGAGVATKAEAEVSKMVYDRYGQ